MTNQMIRQHFGWSKVVMKVNVTFLTLASMPVYVVQIRVCFPLNYSNKFRLNVLMDTMNKFLNKCIRYDLQSIHFCFDIVEQVHICRTVNKFAHRKVCMQMQHINTLITLHRNHLDLLQQMLV